MKAIKCISITDCKTGGVDITYKNKAGKIVPKHLDGDIDYLIRNDIIKLEEWK